MNLDLEFVQDWLNFFEIKQCNEAISFDEYFAKIIDQLSKTLETATKSKFNLLYYH